MIDEGIEKRKVRKGARLKEGPYRKHTEKGRLIEGSRGDFDVKRVKNLEKSSGEGSGD
jgi:hypothetical protein